MIYVIIYLVIGFLYGIRVVYLQLKRRPEHTIWYMLFVIFVYNMIFFPITIPYSIYYNMKKK